MTEVKNTNFPEKCLHCKSHNIIGPYKYTQSGVQVSALIYVRQQAFVCVDCGYTMLFTREGHQDKVLTESLRIQTEQE